MQAGNSHGSLYPGVCLFVYTLAAKKNGTFAVPIICLCVYNHSKCKHSLKRNRQDDCQYVCDETLYISSRLHQLSRAMMYG